MVSRSPSILVVDDSEDFRSLVSNYLRELDCVLSYASDGEDALEMYEACRPDLVVMDIIMPLMDGVDAIRGIRELELAKGLEKVPILAVSAEDSVETVADSMDAGATRMLHKPFGRAPLVETVRELLK